MSRIKASYRFVAAVLVVLPLLSCTISVVFATILHLVEACPEGTISQDCDANGFNGFNWKFEDAFLYVAGNLLFLPLAPTVRVNRTGTIIEHDLIPLHPIGKGADFICSIAALTFFGGTVGLFCELEVVEHLVHLFSAGQPHRKTHLPPATKHSVSLRCELLAAFAYLFAVVPVFVAVCAVPFGAILAFSEGWTFVNGFLYISGIMIQCPSIAPDFKFHSLGGKITLFIIGTYGFCFASALTTAVLVELPLNKKLAQLYEARLFGCGRGYHSADDGEELRDAVASENPDLETPALPENNSSAHDGVELREVASETPDLDTPALPKTES